MFNNIVGAIGRFSYKYRKIICVFAALLLIACIILESQAVISYTYMEENLVTEIFPRDDTLVVVYENEDEEDIQQVIQQLSSNEHVISIQAYANTLGTPMTPMDMSTNFGIDSMFANAVFRMYYNGLKAEPMKLVDFVNFIASNEFLDNPLLVAKIDDSSKDQLYRFKNIVNAINSQKEMNPDEISNLLDIDTSIVKTIMFMSKLQTNNITLVEFINAVDKIANKLSFIMPDETVEQLSMLKTMSQSVLNKELLTPKDVVDMMGTMANNDMFTTDTVNLLFIVAQSKGEYKQIPLFDLVMFLTEDVLTNKMFSDFLDDELTSQLSEAKTMILDGKVQLVGEKHSRMVLTLDYLPETQPMWDFYNELESLLSDNLKGEFYLVGENAMSHEVSKTFDQEYTFISIVTAIVVLLVVCIAFRKFSIPVLLVCVIECSVLAMMSVMTLINFPMFFIALILVQCILMGSMIDYAILLTTYYVEVRNEFSVEDALPEVMKRATHSILTSSLILIVVSFICGLFMEGQVASILMTLGVGSLCAILLILFVLPSLLTIFDRYILKGEKFVHNTEEQVLLRNDE